MLLQDNFNQINVGAFFSRNYIQDLKKRLQIQQGENLIITQNSYQLSITCSNISKDICSFIYLFIKKIDVDSHEIVLQLKKKATFHSPLCIIYNEDYSYDRNRKLIDESKDLVRNIILSRYQLYGPQNPKKILEVVSQSLGYNSIFIHKNIHNTELKRKIKKKFDNLIAEVRRQNKLEPASKKNPKLKKKSKNIRQKLKIYFENLPQQQKQQAALIQIISDEQSSQQNDQQSEFILPINSFEIQSQQKIGLRNSKNGKYEENSLDCLQNELKSANTYETFANRKKRIRKI